MRPEVTPRKCPNCGIEVAATDQVCWRCYRSLPEPTPPPPAPRQRRRWQLPVSPLLAGALVAAVGMYFWHVHSSPTTALMAFLRAEAAGDVKRAYELLSVRSREMVRPEALAEAKQPRQARAPMPTYVVREVKRDNGSAQITLEVIAAAPNGQAPTKSTCCMYVVREGGGWKVDMVRTSQEQVGSRVLVGEHGWFRLWTTQLERR